MIVEQLVDQFDDGRARFDLFGARSWTEGDKGLGSSAPESDVSIGGSALRQPRERDVLDDDGEQAFALTVWRFGIRPERAEISEHGGEPLADSLVKDDLVVLPGALTLFT